MTDRRYDAAIFDMDGTLLDTMLYWRYTTLEYLMAHGHPFRDEDLAAMRHRSSRRFLFELAERDGWKIGTLEEVIREAEGYMKRHYQYDARLKCPEVPDFLEAMKQNGFRMCVATGSPREIARIGLERLGLLSYFEFVTDSYEFHQSKREPEYFHVVAKRLGTVPERCLVFEDALYAMESAKAAGCTVVAIDDDTAIADRDAIHALADRVITRYNDLL